MLPRLELVYNRLQVAFFVKDKVRYGNKHVTKEQITTWCHSPLQMKVAYNYGEIELFTSQYRIQCK